VSEADGSQKHALESLRMEADCMRLVAETVRPNLRPHFLGWPPSWAALASSGPSDAEIRKLN